MTRHSTDFVSALHTERANIISAQGLLSMRLTAIDAVLAVYHPQSRAAQTDPASAPVVDASAEQASVESSATNSPESTGASQERAQTATGLGTGGDHLDPSSRPTATAKTDVPSDQSQASGGGQSQDSSGVRVASVDTNTETPASQPGSEAVADDAGTAPAGEASRPDASPAPTLFQLVKEQHEAHPDWTARQIAEAIGRPPASVQTTLAVVRRGPPVAKPKPKPPAPETLADRVKAVLDEHSDWTARQIADHLGTDQKYVVAAAKRKNLSIRRLTPEEFVAARREGGRKGSAAMKARRGTPAAEPPPPEPELATEPELAEPLDEAEAPVSPFSPRRGDEPPRIKRPKGTEFRLRAGRGEGKWLHMSGTGLTANRTYAWIGTESQLLAVRRKFPEAQDLYEEVVEKEPARA